MFRGIQLYHLPKGGGNFVSTVLNKLCQGSDCYQGPWIEPTGAMHTPGDTSKPMFKIALIRNPCSYYLSVWGFQAMGYRGVDQPMSNHGSVLEQCFEKDDIDNIFNKSKTHGFEKFVNQITPKVQTGVGMLGLRMANLFHPGEGFDWAQCPRQFGESKPRHISNALNNISLEDVHCWLDTDHLSKDLFTCLRLYASLENDATMFKSTVIDSLEAQFGKSSVTGHAIMNEGKHTECEDAFDARMGQLVMSADNEFAKKFGYDKCCAPRPSIIRA